MGFVHVRHDDRGMPVPGHPKETVRLEHLEPDHDGPTARITWRMLDDLGYEPPADVTGLRPFYVAPAHPVGRSTDLASVPPWLWGVIASFGRHTFAALLHDHLCEAASEASPPRAGELRRDADRLFRIGMLDLKVPAPRAWVMWAAVRLFGESCQPGTGSKSPAAVVLAVSLAAWAAVGVAVAGGPGPAVAVTTAAVALAVALVEVLRGRRDLAGAVLLGGLAGALIVPALLVSMATVVILDGLPILGWWLRKVASRMPRSPVRDPGPPPQAGPMRAI